MRQVRQTTQDRVGIEITDVINVVLLLLPGLTRFLQVDVMTQRVVAEPDHAQLCEQLFNETWRCSDSCTFLSAASYTETKTNWIGRKVHSPRLLSSIDGRQFCICHRPMEEAHTGCQVSMEPLLIQTVLPE